MGIEFLEGQITEEQVVIPRTMRFPELSMLQDGECTYISSTGLWMDVEGSLWVDKLAPSFKEPVPEVASDVIRVMKLPQGFVVDISKVTKNFIEETGEFSFTAQDAPESVTDGFAFDRAPVIGFLVSDGEVALFKELVRNTYGYDYPEAVTTPDN